MSKRFRLNLKKIILHNRVSGS